MEGRSREHGNPAGITKKSSWEKSPSFGEMKLPGCRKGREGENRGTEGRKVGITGTQFLIANAGDPLRGTPWLRFGAVQREGGEIA